MSNQTVNKGSWGQRAAIYSLSVVLGLLVYWLIGFFLDDIANIPGPQEDQYMAQLDQSTVKQQADILDQQIDQLQTEISNTQEQQKLLNNALTSTQNSINQILEIQKIQAEKGQQIANNLTSTFQQNTQLFITQQNSLQQLNASLSRLNMQLMPLQNSRDALGKQIDDLTANAEQQYDTAMGKFQLKLGLLQIGLLIILLAIVVFLLFNKSTSYYRLIFTAISIAVLVKIFFVIHDYFPSEYFKYILTISLISLVFFILKDLLKRRAFPAKSYLLKQFRDAYEHFFCPSCEIRSVVARCVMHSGHDVV